MKKIIAFRIIAITLIAIIGITSCSKEDETNKSVTKNAKVSTYLNSFYKKNYQLGKSVDTKIIAQTSALSKSTEIENLVVTEVYVGEDTQARGYVITEESTNEFLYFIDVNRIDYKLTSVKIDENDTKIFNNIDNLDKYASTNGFDIIKVVEDFNSGAEQSNKFWGWISWSWSPCENGFHNGTRTYSVFWIEVAYDYNPGVPC